MIAENDIRGLEALHIYLLKLSLFAYQRKSRQKPDEPDYDNRLSYGLFARIVALFVFIVYFDVDFLFPFFAHKVKTLSLYDIYQCIITYSCHVSQGNFYFFIFPD